MNPNTPSNFLRSTTSSTHPQPVGVRVVEVPAPAPPPRPARTDAVLSVRLPNRVTLSKSLLLAVASLKLGVAIELVPPARRGGIWHLDTRSTAGRRLYVTADGSGQFITSHHLKAEHFLRQQIKTVGEAGAPVKDSIKHTRTSIASLTHELRSRLHFRLGEPLVPGYYALLPV